LRLQKPQRSTSLNFHQIQHSCFSEHTRPLQPKISNGLKRGSQFDFRPLCVTLKLFKRQHFRTARGCERNLRSRVRLIAVRLSDNC
jgi:hypothetical protein